MNIKRKRTAVLILSLSIQCAAATSGQNRADTYKVIRKQAVSACIMLFASTATATVVSTNLFNPSHSVGYGHRLVQYRNRSALAILFGKAFKKKIYEDDDVAPSSMDVQIERVLEKDEMQTSILEVMFGAYDPNQEAMKIHATDASGTRGYVSNGKFIARYELISNSENKLTTAQILDLHTDKVLFEFDFR